MKCIFQGNQGGIGEVGDCKQPLGSLGACYRPQDYRDAGGGGRRYSNFGELESYHARTMLQYEATNEANLGNCGVFRI
jgi:hypothetical protein